MSLSTLAQLDWTKALVNPYRNIRYHVPLVGDSPMQRPFTWQEVVGAVFAPHLWALDEALDRWDVVYEWEQVGVLFKEMLYLLRHKGPDESGR